MVDIPGGYVELDCGEEEVNSRGRDARTSIELAAVGGLTRGKTHSGEGLSHDNYANNRRKVWRNGKLFVSLRKLLRNGELWQIITIYHIS